MDEVDVVVVGAGTGMLAAITAAEEGLEVLVVEKAEHVGGSTALSGGGFWIPGNSILAENGQREDPERVRTYLRAATKGEVADERWQSHIDHGPAAVEVLRRRTPAEVPVHVAVRGLLPRAARRIGDRAGLRAQALRPASPRRATGRCCCRR